MGEEPDRQHDPAFQAERTRRMAQQADDAYRALGRYFVTFSRLTRTMRWGLAQRLAIPGDPPSLIHLPMGELPATMLANAYFGVCRELGNLDADELRVESWLRNEVIEEAQDRNFYAHADWMVGWAPLDSQDMDTPLAVRVKPDRTKGAWESKGVTTADLDAKSSELGNLTNWVSEFGAICFGTHPMGLLQGGIRVGDIFIREDRKAPVKRNGPRVSEFPGWFDHGGG